MAQIIKQRRGSISQLKDVTARISELVVATGSIGNLNGPFLFVGETEGVAGAYRPISKIYQGAAAPTITVGSYGSVLDGTPFYASGDKSLYILSQAGNSRVDLTGNIEGNTISNVTITSLTGSNAYITNLTGGTLNVTGTTNLGGNLSITGDTIQTGSIDLTGDIKLGGNITIGNQTTDIIQFGGEVSSSILPIVHNAFDLGSPDKNWRNLHVSGTAYINILEAQSISLDGITVFEDLIVSGSSYLGTGGGDQVIVSGSLYNDALTNNRVVIVGTNGLLEDDVNFTFDGTTLKVGSFEADQSSGNVRTSGSVFVNSDLNVSGSVALGDMSTDNVIVSGTLYTHNTTYLGDMNTSLGDALIVSGGVKVNGSQFISNDLSVSGSVTLGDMSTDNVIVSGTIYAHNTTYLGDMSTIYGPNDALVVSGAISQKGNNNINGDLNVSGSTLLGDTISDNTIVSGTLYTHNTTYLGDMNTLLIDALIVSGNVKQRGDQIVSGDVSVGNTLKTNHIADYNNANLDITTYGTLTLESTNALSIELKSDNAESGVNYLNVNSGSVNFSTYDITSGLTHKVLLDNTGSLRFENVAIGITGSLGISGSLDVKEDVIVHRNLYVSGNLELLGTASYVNISSSQVDLGTNIINLNTYAPFERFGGISVHDSGSSIGLTGSLLWDAVNNVWIYSNPSGSDYASARFIAGPKNTGSLGDETGLTVGHFPIATGDDHISDSLLTYLGTTLAFNTNKFTIDSGTGDTLVSGNFTLSYSGGTDNNTKTSAIMFRNSSNVVGFVSTTETTDVLDGILGYKNSNGGLIFSTVIDGGTY